MEIDLSRDFRAKARASFFESQGKQRDMLFDSVLKISDLFEKDILNPLFSFLDTILDSLATAASSAGESTDDNDRDFLINDLTKNIYFARKLLNDDVSLGDYEKQLLTEIFDNVNELIPEPLRFCDLDLPDIADQTILGILTRFSGQLEETTPEVVNNLLNSDRLHHEFCRDLARYHFNPDSLSTLGNRNYDTSFIRQLQEDPIFNKIFTSSCLKLLTQYLTYIYQNSLQSEMGDVISGHLSKLNINSVIAVAEDLSELASVPALNIAKASMDQDPISEELVTSLIKRILEETDPEKLCRNLQQISALIRTDELVYETSVLSYKRLEELMSQGTKSCPLEELGDFLEKLNLINKFLNSAMELPQDLITSSSRAINEDLITPHGFPGVLIAGIKKLEAVN